MARTYKRDARGRFASGGSSSGGGSKGKTLKRGRAQLSEARGKVRTAKGKLAAFDPADQTTKSSLSKRAQRGAITKAEKRLTTVKRTAVIKGRRMTGTIGKPKAGRGEVARISRAEPLMTGGTLAARSSLTRARRKLAENATPAQRGAVTRAKKYAAQSYDKNTQPRKFGRPASVMRKRPPESPLRWQVGGGKAGVSTKKASGKKTVTGDRVGRMIGRLAARRDQLIARGSGIDARSNQSKDVVRRAIAFVQGKAYTRKNTKQQNFELNRQHEKAIASGRPQDSPLYKNVARAIESSPRRRIGTQRKKTKQEVLWQADRIIGKTIKKMTATVGKGKGNPIRTQNSRQVSVERFLARKGLLGEYRRLTAAADPILMKPAGPGIKQPRRRR